MATRSFANPSSSAARASIPRCDSAFVIRYDGRERSRFNGPAQMLNEIYNSQILKFASDIRHLGRLDAPDATATAHSRLCGSRVKVDLCMKEGKVSEFAHDVKACALGQASSSIMSRRVLGSTGGELREVRDRMHAMLKNDGPPPDGRWSDLEILLPVRDFKARHASTLLTFDAVCDAVGQIESATEAAD